MNTHLLVRSNHRRIHWFFCCLSSLLLLALPVSAFCFTMKGISYRTLQSILFINRFRCTFNLVLMMGCLVTLPVHAANYTASYLPNQDINGLCRNASGGQMTISPAVPTNTLYTAAERVNTLHCTTDSSGYMTYTIGADITGFNLQSSCGGAPPYNLVRSVTLYNSSGSNISVSYESPLNGTVLGSFSAAPGVNTYSLGASGVSVENLWLKFSSTTQLQVVSWGLDNICGIQNISFTPPTSGTYGGSTTLSASATSSLPVTFTSATPSICAVSSTNGTTIKYDNVGTCTIYANQAGDAYYRAAPQVSGNITVSKATLTATANNKSRVYGAANPAFDFSYSGFIVPDNETTAITPPIANSTETTTSATGNYSITCSSGGSATNYDITCVSGTLTITKAPLTATANDKSRVYGAANPAFDFSYSGFIGSDNETTAIITSPTANSTETTTSAAGNYPITCSDGSATNYDVICVDGTLTIGKAPLTAQLNDKTRYFGAANPVFDFTYTGFLNGDTDTVLDTKPVGSTSATTTDPAGLYGINCTNGSDNNYDITCQNGTLYVVKGTVESIPMFNQTILFDTPVGQKQTKSLTLKNRGTSALIFNSINTPVAPFSYPKPMPFTFIPTGDPSGSPQSFDISCTPTEMGVKNMTLQITTNDPDNPVIAYPLECMGRQVVAVSSVANNSAVNFGNALINSTLSQSITITENGNSDLILLSASITGTNAADFQITAPTEFPATVADGTTSSQTITVSCTPKTATPLTATLQITTNDPVNATLNYPLQCGGLFTLTLSTSGQGTITGCGTSCVQNYQQDAAVTVSATPATGWQLGSWSGNCVNGKVTMTGNQSCTVNFTQVIVNPTTPGTTPPTGTTTTPTNTTTTPSTPTIPTGTTGNSTTTTPPTITTPPTGTTPGNTNTSNPLPTDTNSSGGANNMISVIAAAPTNNWVVNGVMSNYNQVATNLTVPENTSVSGGVLMGNIRNDGLIANVIIAPNATVTGGKLSGFNINLGTLNNVTVSQYSQVQGGNYTGTSYNQGILINPIVLPAATIVNTGTIANPLLLSGATLLGGRITGVIITLGGTYQNTQVPIGTRIITKVADIPPEIFAGFDAQTLAALPRDFVSQITPEQFAAIPVAAISGLTTENMGAISPQVIQTLDKEQIEQLNPDEFKAMPTNEVSKLLTNFDAEQITPQEAEKLLPQRWTIDSYGNLTAPPGIRISLRNMDISNLPPGLTLSNTPDLNSSFALGGRGTRPVLNQINQMSATEGFSVAQQKTGVVHASSSETQKRQFSFMVDPDMIFLLDENALRGLQMNEQGQYIIVTEDGKQIPITPMTKDPEALLNVLGENGGVDIQKSGEVVLKFNPIKRSRDGQEVHQVGMFDPFVEPAPEGVCTPEGVCDWSQVDASMQPGIRSARNTRAKSIMVKVIYPDGTAQQVYPTVLSPEILVAEAQKIAGVEKIIFRMDGTFAVTYEGVKLLLSPESETLIQPIDPKEDTVASLTLVNNKLLTYRVPYQGNWLQTDLVVSLFPEN